MSLAQLIASSCGSGLQGGVGGRGGRGEGGRGGGVVGQLNSNQCVKTRGQAMRPKLWSTVILNLQILSTSRFGWYNFIITNQVLVGVSEAMAMNEFPNQNYVIEKSRLRDL